MNSRSRGSPRVGPYCSATALLSRTTRSAMMAMRSAGNVSGFGAPPANVMMSGSLMSFANARIADGRMFAASAEKNESKGAKLFQQSCAACHPGGGNIIKPAMTLHKKDLDAHGVKTAKDIVGKMRNPGPGMTRFDTKTVSDEDAMEIAQYVVKTFK